MSWGRRILRGAAVVPVLAAAVLITPLGQVSATATGRRADPIQMTVLGMTPSSPAISSAPQPLTVRLGLTNTTDRPIRNVTIQGERGEPLTTQASLDADLAHPGTSGSEQPIPPKHKVQVDLPAEAHGITVTFATTTELDVNAAGICLCATGVYPLDFTAHLTTSAGDEQLGTARTYLPSFLTQPRPRVQVSWVWPLIERPHRLLGESEFTDDNLADLVTSGRLSRSLQVIEAVGPRVPITLVIDPELLDELEVMATGKYTVRASPTATAVPGTGGTAARTWLVRLRNVLDNDPLVDVDLTPYADPDVQSLTGKGLSWNPGLPAGMATRVTQALAGRPPDRDISWPVSGAIGQRTLNTLAASGTLTVLLDSTALKGKGKDAGTSIATLRTDSGLRSAALTTPAVQKYVASAVAVGGNGDAALAPLVSEIAMRAVDQTDQATGLVLTPPRYVDPSPAEAARAILETSTSTFSAKLALRSAAADRPNAVSHLARIPADAPALPDRNRDYAVSLSRSVPQLASLLARSSGAQPLVTSLPPAVQRVESSAWIADVSGGPATGLVLAGRLASVMNAITSKVHIVKPRSGSYTLASNNSPLPVTVENDTDYAVAVTVGVRSVGNLPGFHAGDLGVQLIQPHAKQPLHVPTRVDRSGRIQVEAQLKAPNGALLGRPVSLYVHSTALGTVGVVITVVAGSVLLLALLIRLLRRLRARRRRPNGPLDSQPLHTEAEPVADNPGTPDVVTSHERAP